MNIISTKIPDLFIIEPKVFSDSRGYFFEPYNRKKFSAIIPEIQFVQDNESMSQYGVIRGLHYQVPPYAQNKLVRVIKGAVWDIAVDIRRSSPTFGQSVGIELTETNKLQFFVPAGFAHGFAVLEPDTIFSYKVDNYYAPEHERGILYCDEELNINWPKIENPVISEKDKILPGFKDAEYFF